MYWYWQFGYSHSVPVASRAAAWPSVLFATLHAYWSPQTGKTAWFFPQETLYLALPKTAERLAANKAAARARKVSAPRPTAASHRRPSLPPVPLGAWTSGTERRGRSPRYRWGRWTKPWVPPRMASRGFSRLPPYSPHRACPLPPVTALPAL